MQENNYRKWGPKVCCYCTQLGHHSHECKMPRNIPLPPKEKEEDDNKKDKEEFFMYVYDYND